MFCVPWPVTRYQLKATPNQPSACSRLEELWVSEIWWDFMNLMHLDSSVPCILEEHRDDIRARTFFSIFSSLFHTHQSLFTPVRESCSLGIGAPGARCLLRRLAGQVWGQLASAQSPHCQAWPCWHAGTSSVPRVRIGVQLYVFMARSRCSCDTADAHLRQELKARASA